jgi:asparagine synthase (glutamine-hydrolysing)
MTATGGTEKGLRRAAVQAMLPEPLRSPGTKARAQAHLPAYAAAVAHAVREMLRDKSAPILPLLDDAFARALCDETLAPGAPLWFGQSAAGPRALAYLLQVNWWLTKYQVEIDL